MIRASDDDRSAFDRLVNRRALRTEVLLSRATGGAILSGTNIASGAKASEPMSLNALSRPRLSGAARTC